MDSYYSKKESGMKIGIMQPYFFPYIGYWQLINAVDKYVVYDDVAYIKGGWISRNNILLDNRKHLITLPLEQPSSFKNINQTDVTHNIAVRKKVIRTIEAAYFKAPYYATVMPVIARLILNSTTISDLNYQAILEIKNYLGISTEIILSSELKKDNSLKAQDKVIHINKLLQGDEYINAIGGKELYSTTEFMKNGLKLKFLKTGDVIYKQFDSEFVQGLSIIDILMFNSIDEIVDYLGNYTLV